MQGFTFLAHYGFGQKEETCTSKEEAK